MTHGEKKGRQERKESSSDPTIKRQWGKRIPAAIPYVLLATMECYLNALLSELRMLSEWAYCIAYLKYGINYFGIF